VTHRINRITLTLDVYEPFTGVAGAGGEHSVTFEVDAATDPALVAACENAWRVWFDRVMVDLAASGDTGKGGIANL
jgi:hypothetical protein